MNHCAPPCLKLKILYHDTGAFASNFLEKRISMADKNPQLMDKKISLRLQADLLTRYSEMVNAFWVTNLPLKYMETV